MSGKKKRLPRGLRGPLLLGRFLLEKPIYDYSAKLGLRDQKAKLALPGPAPIQPSDRTLLPGIQTQCAQGSCPRCGRYIQSCVHPESTHLSMLCGLCGPPGELEDLLARARAS